MQDYQLKYLLENDEVKQALNMSDNYNDFVYHWDNFELSYVTRIKPSLGLYESLTKAYKVEKINKKYYKPWLEKLQRIVKEKQCEKINGQYCDMTTANMMLSVYEALNDKNKEKFKSMSFPVAHHVAFKLLEKCQA